MKKRSKKTDLTLIILNYNTQFWLKKTLETLKEFYLDNTKYNIKIIVVDNGSVDDSVKMVKKNIKWAELIEAGENLGFAGGNNLALEKVKSKYAMLLNSDLEFKPESNLDILIEYMDKHPEVGIITPKIEFINGEIDPACHRGEPTLWASFTYFTKLERLFPKSQFFGQYHQYYKDLTSHHIIDACSGATLVVRKSAMDKVGLLDDRFFMYGEDLDWCRRFRDKGYQVIYHPEVKIIHHKYKSGIKSSSKKIAQTTNKYFYDTMLAYYDKHYVDKYPKFIRTLIKYYINIKKGGF
ncbi:MAG: glycosyltransferase family 2 protein [Patescibacteria group bacterium]